MQMSNHTIKVFLADYVPLQNRGEEAIIRGIEDLLQVDSTRVEFTMFGPETDVSIIGNITIIPESWVFSTRIRHANSRFRRFLTVLSLRSGWHGRLKRLKGSNNQEYRIVSERFLASDLVLVGHDGFLCVENSIALTYASQHQKAVGILGAGLGHSQKRHAEGIALPLWEAAMESCNFAVFREKGTLDFLKSITRTTKDLILAPDPAFAMKSASSDETHRIISAFSSLRTAQNAGKVIVSVCVCEKSVVFSSSFLAPYQLGSGLGQRIKRYLLRRFYGRALYRRKRTIHTAFVARLLDELIDQRNVHILFVPHSVESGVGNDLDVARRIADEMKSGRHDYTMLEGDYGARALKGIIKQTEFLISERTHAVIGAISTGTPFMSLTNSSDRRTHEIVGEMCNCGELLFDMDNPQVGDAVRALLNLFDRRNQVSVKLEHTGQGIRQQLETVRQTVTMALNHAKSKNHH